jgi:hypothetical protein
MFVRWMCGPRRIRVPTRPELPVIQVAGTICFARC